MNRYTVPISVAVGVVVVALSLWAWVRANSIRVVEGAANFEIPLGTEVVSERYESTGLGAEIVRVSAYKLGSDYAKGVSSRCAELGYKRITVADLDMESPMLATFASKGSTVCFRRVRGEYTSVAMLQGDLLVVIISE